MMLSCQEVVRLGFVCGGDVFQVSIVIWPPRHKWKKKGGEKRRNNKRLPPSSTIFGLYSPMREDIEEGKGKPIYYCDYCYSSLTLLQFSYGQQPREVEEKHNTLLKWHCIILAFEINQGSNGNLDEWVSFLAELTIWIHATYFKLKKTASVSLALFWQIFKTLWSPHKQVDGHVCHKESKFHLEAKVNSVENILKLLSKHQKITNHNELFPWEKQKV